MDDVESRITSHEFHNQIVNVIDDIDHTYAQDIHSNGDIESTINIDEIQQQIDINQEEHHTNPVANPIQQDISVLDKVDGDESDGSNEFHSPGGTLYSIPSVPNHMRPDTKAIYKSFKDVENLYYAYANEGGFDVRKATSKKSHGSTTLKYLLCNREGSPNTSTVDTLDVEKSKIKRRTSMFRTGCPACIRFHVIPGTETYQIYEFVERHNHKLVSKSNNHLLRGKRKLNFSQQSVIYKMSNQNVGATSCHTLMSEIEGGYHVRSAQPDDFKNFWRDLNSFIGGTDAQMLVDKMICRKENVPNFTFDYRVDDRKLVSMFWADETSKLQYKEFGDVVSFDATYCTNRYGMIFVPFTGIDNHKKCVTFGAGLLSNELTESYVWLLNAFMRAFVTPPVLVLSDQDPAMKKAIAEVPPHSHHRLCMWHITSKLSKKIDWDIFNKSDFKRRFNYLVWNSVIDEDKFEEGWNLLIKDFNLYDKRWFKDMYELRHAWIPSYFKHVPMSGLMRTTSRSESQNSSFQNSTMSGSMLVNFMNSFESSMEKQRYAQSMLDFKTNEKDPKIRTYLKIERNASKHYTRKVFFQVQNEIIHSIFSCTQKCVTNSVDIDRFVIREKKGTTECIMNQDSDSDSESDEIVNDAEFEVIFNKPQESFVCQCMLFEHMGILCRHIFCVFKYVGYDDIPEKYILRRWRKDIIPTEILRKCFRYGDTSENIDKVAIEIYSIIGHCLSTLSHDPNKLAEYLQHQKDLMSKVDDDHGSDEKHMDKNHVFEKLLGVKTPGVVDILNPGSIRTKGSGTRKRIKSARELSIQTKPKEGRKCSVCGKKNRHNARSCPARTKVGGMKDAANNS